MTCFNLDLKPISVAESRCVERAAAATEARGEVDAFMQAIRRWSVGPGDRRIYAEGRLSQDGELTLNGTKVVGVAVSLIEAPANVDSHIGVLIAVDPYEDHEAETTEGPFCEVRVCISRAMFEALANRASPRDGLRLFVDLGSENVSGPLRYDHAPGDLTWTTTEGAGRILPIESYSLTWTLPDARSGNVVETAEESISHESLKRLEATASGVLPALFASFQGEMAATRTTVRRLGYGLALWLTILAIVFLGSR